VKIIRKIMCVILSVIVLLCVGCSNDQTSSEMKENVVAIDEKNDEIETEVSDVELSVKETVSEASIESVVTQSSKQDVSAQKDIKEDSGEKNNANTDKKDNSKETEVEPTPQVTEEKKPEQPKEESTKPAPEEPVFVSYDPSSVVALATSKTKGYGKISIPEDLDKMLANGEITRELYDQCYPYDGAGYYSVFVEINLAQASTTSGSKLETVDGIASYISGMLGTGPLTYFYIEYAGVSTVGGKEFHEFRCYRA